ncbi:hypothetical protein BSL78_23022 [Apostichopus japonicus]|uniref:Reverse transcriptase domain-containing protein n=1 Tax=Stichopus japonicus TaxID=307972 RepID=A0A2G8JWG4_STIJA|nr:hypothetical protein BSL78_23022 [Apostichopus japonicus]
MPHLVGDLQTCAVKGHCIQQNLWLMRDLTDFVIERDLPCALVSLDQQKAFDMVDRGFLMNVLETFQLHPNFRKWISVLYEESFSSVIVNGFCSEVFNVERGVRQGCPLSPLLYVLFSESLSRLLERDSRLVPFVVPGGAKVKCAQYADDVTCVVSSLGSFRALSQDLSIFERATGAKLNPEKTKGLRLGSWRYRDLPFGASWSDQNIKINGIWFGYDAPVMSPGARGLRYLRAARNLWHPLAFDLGKSPLLIVFVSPILWYPGAVYQFRVASWCGWRGDFFIHMVWWYRAGQEGGIVPKTGEGGTRGGSSGNLIKDRIVCGVRSEALKERLLREADLKLEKAVNICRAAELSKTQSKELKQGPIEIEASCQAMTSYVKGKTQSLEFLIVNLKAQCILGLRSSVELGLIQRVETVNADSHHTGEDISQEFSDVMQGIGCIKQEHHIELNEDGHPCVHPPRKIPLAMRKKLKAELDTMEKKVKREHYQLPTVDELTSELAGAQYFSVLDANSGFWQIPLDDESSDLCCFNTPFGRYKFLRLPFGLHSAPEVFHKTMCQIMDGIPGCQVYIDDILVCGKTKEEHDKRLRLVFERATEHNLRLNKSKCKLGVREVKYLGHILSKNGMRIDNAKVQAIVDMPSPNSKKELERFLGIIQYLSKFIPDLSTEAAQLRMLLRKDVEWQWDSTHEKAYKKLKQLATEAPVLQFYDPKKPITLSVDSSQNGLGAVLLQGELPVAYASKTLTPTQENYAQIEKRCYQ